MTTAQKLSRHTDVIVGGVCILVFGYLAWFVLPSPALKVAVALALSLETWTLVNRWRNDTISEAIVRLSDKYKLIPMFYGMGLGYGLSAGWFDFISLCLGGLACHWWFSMQCDREHV